MALEDCTCSPKPVSSTRENEPNMSLADEVDAQGNRWHCVVYDRDGAGEVIYRQAMVVASQAFLDSMKFEVLNVSSSAVADFDGIPAVDADGSSTHTVTIKKVDNEGTDVTTGTEAIRVLSTASVPISATNPSLASGTVNITIGPVSDICDFTLTAVDPAGNLETGKSHLRFK